MEIYLKDIVVGVVVRVDEDNDKMKYDSVLMGVVIGTYDNLGPAIINMSDSLQERLEKVDDR